MATLSLVTMLVLMAMPGEPAHAAGSPGGGPEAEIAETEVYSELSGFVGFELRAFAEDAAFAGQDDDLVGSVVLEPEYFREWTPVDPDAPVDRLVVRPFLRLDSVDDERSHFDLRELYWQRVGDGWELDVGLGKVFWGVTESLHLVDVINQTDAVEDPDGEDKLGQPMIRLGLSRSWGLLELFVLPGFRERTFVGEDGRLRPGIEIDTDGALYASSAEQGHVDLAVRWSQVLGDVDLGVSYFRGTEREPLLVPRAGAQGSVLVPYYAQVDRLGVDLQATLGAWLWKLEALYRWSDDPQAIEPGAGAPADVSRGGLGFGDHGAAVAGFEYTFFDLRGSGLDVGLLLEYLWDERGDAATTAFEDDVFVATRLAWNDAQSTELLVGGAIDAESGAVFVTVEGSRRLGERFEAELRLRAFDGAEGVDPLVAFDRDDYLQLAIKRYF